jgi:flagellar motor switch protein FliM
VTTHEPQTHDFRKPSRLPHSIEQPMLDWQYAAGRLVPEKFARHLSIPGALGVRPPETVSVGELEMSPADVVFRVAIEGLASPTIMVLAGPLGNIIANAMVGEVLEAVPEPKPLTNLEAVLSEIAVAQLIEGLNEAAKGLGLPSCKIANHETTPHVLRIFPGEEQFLRLRFDFRCSLGDFPWNWIWPGSVLRHLFPEKTVTAARVQTTNDALCDVAHRIPLDLRVKLGTAKIAVTDLANLAVGDVIVLDQPVNQELACYIGDQPLLFGLPGIQGGRQVFQVTRNESPA